jgi:uncharacterized protein YndB with AHSA1/START domain
VLTREITLPVDPDRLWEALADPSEWIGARVDWDLVPGGRARFVGDPDGDRAGRVDEVLPGRRLSFHWWPEADREDESEVTYELEPAEEGTRLVVTERRVGHEAGAEGPQASACWTPWDGRLVGLWGTHDREVMAATSGRRVTAGSGPVRLSA